MSLLEAELPAGRRWAKVGDFYEVTRKPRTLDISGLASIPFAPMDAIPQDGNFEPTYTLKAPTADTSGTYFERSDLLVAKITPSFENGKQAIAIGLPADFGYATTEVIPLRPRESGHDRRLLFYFLLHPDVRAFVAEKMEGTTGRKRVPENVLLDLPFPESNGGDQSSIADALQLVHRSIHAETRSINNTADLKRAVMRELFTCGLRNEARKETEIGLVPESWEVATIGAHFFVASGGTPSRDKAKYWDGGTIPWVKTTEVNYGIINSTGEHITPIGLANSAAKLLPIGTLLMAMYGQGVTRGRVGILGIEAACNQACAAMNARDEAVNPHFLFHFLSYRYEAIRQMAHGGQQQNLNLEIVRDLPLVFPNDDLEQREIVSILDALDRKIDLHKRKRAVLEDLFKALLHKLMTGEIRVADLDLSALSASSNSRSRRMSDLKISEAGTVQFPMVKHAAEIGWTPLTPEVAKQKRGGEAGMLLRDELEAKLSEFNPWLSADARPLDHRDARRDPGDRRGQPRNAGVAARRTAAGTTRPRSATAASSSSTSSTPTQTSFTSRGSGR